jgi:hypothetical protein
MSDFAFFRFVSNNILTEEEKEHKEEIIQLTDASNVMLVSQKSLKTN